MKRYEIHNFLPFRRQRKAKHENPCPLFYGDLALLNGQLEVIASRGTHLQVGKQIPVNLSNRRFLAQNLPDGKRVALRERYAVRLFTGELLRLGLTVLLMPCGPLSRDAAAMCYLAEGGNVAVSPQLRRAAETVGEPVEEGGEAPLTEAECLAAEDEMALLDTVLSPDGETRLADYIRCVADYAGCSIRYLEATDLPLSACGQNRERLTAFLLCACLTARKTENSGAGITAEQVGSRLRICVRTNCPESENLPLRFLQNPAFSGAGAEFAPDVSLTLTDTLELPDLSQKRTVTPFL